MIFKIISIIQIISLNKIAAYYAREYAYANNIGPLLNEPRKELKVNFINKSQDIQLKHFENAQIIQSNSSSIFLLNGIDLFALKIEDNFDEKRNLKLIGHLDGINDQTVSEIKATSWKGYEIFVVALDSYYNVYVVKNEESTDVLVPIEKLAKQGSQAKIDFLQFNRELYCIILNVMLDRERSSILHIYKWRKSHFTLLKEVSIQAVDDLFMYSTEKAAVIVTVNYFSSRTTKAGHTVLNVYVVTDDNSLRHIQTLYLDFMNIFPVTLNDHLYFYGVSHTGLLTSYQWDSDNFVKWLDYKDLKNTTNLISGDNFIIGQMNDQLQAFTNAQLISASKISSNYSRNFNEIIVMNNDRSYLGLVYKNVDELRITVLEAEFEVLNEQNLRESRDSAKNCFANLRDAQRANVLFIEYVKNMIQIPLIYYKDHEVRAQNPMVIKTVSIARKENISRVVVNVDLKVSKEQLKLRSKLESLKNTKVRHKRHLNNVSADSLGAHTVTVKRLNIPKEMFENILVKSDGKAIYKGRLTTKTLTANSIKYKKPRDAIVGSILPNEYTQVNGMHTIRNIQVHTINGVNWNDFLQSLYLRGSPQPIEGNLIVLKQSQIQRLNVHTINGLPVDTFVTLNTAQEISSDVTIPTFHTVRIVTSLINGVDFKNDVARLNENNVIETPVKILHAYIGDLTLANSEDDKIIARHIVGTRVEDLSQIYNGKVVIKGSLKLTNVILDNPKTSIFVDEQQFTLNVADHYWMKTVDQNLGDVIFSSIISAPQLFTESINNIATDNFIITNVQPKKPMNLYLQKVFVKGNIYTDPQFETNLKRINKECVRRGSSTTISGTKIFTGILSVNDFTGRLDDYPAAENFVSNNEHNKKKFFLDCTKQFDSVVIINGNLEFGGNNLDLVSFKGVNLLEFFRTTARIDVPTRLETLTFQNIKVMNLTMNLINDFSFNEIIAGLENSLGQKGNLKSVRVDGVLNILGNLLVNTINDINFDQYLGLVVTSQSGGQIGGIKRFLAGLNVVNLNIRRVNSIDFVYWLDNALLKHSEQVIGQNWTLASISVGEMNAYMINGIKTKEIIDLTADVIDIRSDIRAKTIDVRDSMNGFLPCNVKDLDNILDNGPTKRNWNFIDVNGYVEWPQDNVLPINQILVFAMTGYDQVITGDTSFANIAYMDYCQSTGTINNVDIKHMFQDALLKESKLQVIKGPKIFKQPINVTNMEADRDLQTPFINGVDVVYLNNSIFRIGDTNIVSGTIIFDKPPLIDRLHLDGTINGAQINDIVFANSTTTVPPIFFYNPILIREHLTIVNAINAINYNYLIEHIIRKTGQPQEIIGSITFQNLIVQGDTKIPLINRVDVNNIVLKAADSIQEILDHKTIIGDVYLDGPAVITNINGLEVVGAFSNSVFLDQNMNIRKLDVMADVVVHKGFTVNSHLNGQPIYPLMNWKPPTHTELVPIWSKVHDRLNEAELLLNQNYGKSFHILYLDYASNVRIKFEANNHTVSFIVDTVHAGEECGLDHKCECPAQYDISLSPFQQIHIHRRPYFHRMFKIFGSNCNVTVKTYFANYCAPNNVEETLIEWSTRSGSGTLTIDKPIFGVKLFEIGSEAFLLINQLNGSITAMKLDQRTNNWIKSDQINGNNAHLEVLEWTFYKVLIVFSRTNEIKQHPIARLFFYNTDRGKEGFQVYQEISGEYNLCSKIYMTDDDKFVLFLSKTESQFISIFIVHWGAQFQFLQTLALDAGIKTFVAFRVDDSYCLAVVTTTGYLYIYKYNNIEGWIPIVYGFFTEIESIVPFKYFNKIYLFVSMKNSATVIRVYSQGLH